MAGIEIATGELMECKHNHIQIGVEYPGCKTWVRCADCDTPIKSRLNELNDVEIVSINEVFK